ncbi:MAG: L17 family ribosomal protein [Oscillospiraceae bacterium]|nr:L17 family ribosomal protein [Oscillospiraceae bacterium]
MSGHRKLGRTPDIRLSMLRGLTTDLLVKGKITTTETRAKEVRKIAEQLITLAVKYQDAFETRDVLVSKAKLDSKGHKALKRKTSKNGVEYDVVERELTTAQQQVDSPARLAARRQAMKWLVQSESKDGKTVNPVNILFNDVAPKYNGRSGGYTRITAVGPRRGDAALMAVIELI